MKPTLGRTAGWVLGAVWMFSGCIENEKSLVIRQVVPAEITDKKCTWKVQTSDTSVYLPNGLSDVGFFSDFVRYRLELQVENYLPNNFSSAGLDSNSIKIEYAEVKYLWLKGREQLAGFSYGSDVLSLEKDTTVSFTGIVIGSASGDGKPGTIVAEFFAFDPTTGVKLKVFEKRYNDISSDPSIVDKPAEIRKLGLLISSLVLGLSVNVFGTTLGGQKVTSSEFVFPIFLCLGCLSEVCCKGAPDESLRPMCLLGQDGFSGDCECDTP